MSDRMCLQCGDDIPLDVKACPYCETPARKWTKKQIEALEALEAAFERCRKAGLAFVGMDTKLGAYIKKDLDAAMSNGSSLYDAQMTCGQGVRVDTSDTYLDSGGW